MKVFGASSLLFTALMALTLSTADASTLDEKTVITFREPVAVPGQVLTPGTYVFRLADSASDRNIVQVFTKDERRLLGTFLAIPDYRAEPSDRPLVSFEERASGEPEAIKAWFYPGRMQGHQFVYPKPKALALAQANNTTVPAMPAELAVVTIVERDDIAPTSTTEASADSQPAVQQQVAQLKQAPVESVSPSEDADAVVEVEEVVVVEEDQPAQLPRTASNLPLIGLTGLLMLCAAGALRLVPVCVKK